MFNNTIKTFRQGVKQVCPPIILAATKKLAKVFMTARPHITAISNPAEGQNLNVYWEAGMAEVLETWGEKSVWKEFQLLLVGCHGKVLDIACGTGKTMEIIAKFPLDVHGCDISDLLIGRAIQRGIKKNHLTVCDATKMPYENDSFDYAYSIGSLEHFTEEGIAQFLAECNRVVCKTSFHMIPVSRNGKNNGWVTTQQSYYNNSVSWWLDKYQSVYKQVYVLDSTWEDEISLGKWFVCVRS